MDKEDESVQTLTAAFKAVLSLKTCWNKTDKIWMLQRIKSLVHSVATCPTSQLGLLFRQDPVVRLFLFQLARLAFGKKGKYTITDSETNRLDGSAAQVQVQETICPSWCFIDFTRKWLLDSTNRTLECYDYTLSLEAMSNTTSMDNYEDSLISDHHLTTEADPFIMDELHATSPPPPPPPVAAANLSSHQQPPIRISQTTKQLLQIRLDFDTNSGAEDQVIHLRNLSILVIRDAARVFAMFWHRLSEGRWVFDDDFTKALGLAGIVLDLSAELDIDTVIVPCIETVAEQLWPELTGIFGHLTKAVHREPEINVTRGTAMFLGNLTLCVVERLVLRSEKVGRWVGLEMAIEMAQLCLDLVTDWIETIVSKLGKSDDGYVAFQSRERETFSASPQLCSLMPPTTLDVVTMSMLFNLYTGCVKLSCPDHVQNRWRSETFMTDFQQIAADCNRKASKLRSITLSPCYILTKDDYDQVKEMESCVLKMLQATMILIETGVETPGNSVID